MSEELRNIVADALDTPIATLKPPDPDVHRGQITSVTAQMGEYPVIKIGLHSIDAGFEDEFAVFVPQAFVDNIQVTGDELDDSTPENGGPSERQRLAIAVANQHRTATLQAVRGIAQRQKGPYTGDAPANFDEFVAFLDNYLSGVEVVFRRAADKNPKNPEFASRRRVRQLYPIEAMSNPKLFKGHVRAWETE